MLHLLHRPHPQPSAIRLIATDLDGTLLQQDSSVSDRALAALSAARDAGWTIVAATGRPVPFALHSLAPAFGLVDYIVGGNGRETVSLDADGATRVVHRAELAAHAAVHAARHLRSMLPGIRFSFAADRMQVAEPGYIERLPLPMQLRVVDDAIAALLDSGAGALTHMAAWHDDHQATELTGMIADVLPAPLVAGHAGMDAVDIQPGIVDKGLGLARLCEHLGVEAAGVVAFGDWENDRSMLRWAGWGVAMGSADDETKAAADTITAPNHEDGVAFTIENLLAALR